jgi:hypothetical protein
MLVLLGVFGTAGMTAELVVPPKAPRVVWIPEMQPFDEAFSGKAECTPAEIDSFDREWKYRRDAVAVSVTTEAVVGISRWAAAQTRDFKPSTNWISKLPMHPAGLSMDGKRILFGQDTEEGIPLPAHSPIVFRRLLVGAVFDREAKTITKVYITIRGWREE